MKKTIAVFVLLLSIVQSVAAEDLTGQRGVTPGRNPAATSLDQADRPVKDTTDAISRETSKAIDPVTGKPSDLDPRARLGNIIDCSKANNDIAILEAEKSLNSSRIQSGTQLVNPTGPAAALISGSVHGALPVSPAQYGRDIDTKINQIKTLCAIQ
jgi:hypothetical protein